MILVSQVEQHTQTIFVADMLFVQPNYRFTMKLFCTFSKEKRLVRQHISNVHNFLIM